jgi:CheY-like chemotaxis protein
MGLGLAIVRRLAALCGHEVELASTPGRGSRFSITVPRAPALVPVGRPPRAGPRRAITALADDEARGDAVDLIVADLRLAEGKSGIDAIAKLRERLGADTPALVVSGDTSAAAQAEVRAAGVKLLVKPVVAAALREASEDAIRSRRERSLARMAARKDEEPGIEPGSSPCEERNLR